ncbi:MAG: hypothetical protein E6I22_06720 [Chloroflexi bacterium]|nr:MAG: hypothetical protein E6I22_06720 [Chloroflexota bacterium]
MDSLAPGTLGLEPAPFSASRPGPPTWLVFAQPRCYNTQGKRAGTARSVRIQPLSDCPQGGVMPAKKKSSSKKSTAKRSTARRGTAKKATAKRTGSKRTTAKRTSAKRSTAKRSTAKKSTAKRSTARKATEGGQPQASRRGDDLAKACRPTQAGCPSGGTARAAGGETG